MANKKQSWSKLADSFGMDPEHDVSNQERDQFIETSRREEIAKAAKAKSLDNFLNPGLTTKILARLGFKGAVEKVQLYHEAKSERVEQARMIREAAKATEQAAADQTREALSNEQSLRSYTESTLGDRKATENGNWMKKYLEAGQEAERKLVANEEEFRAQVEAQGLAMERMIATHKRGEQEIAEQKEAAEQTERKAQEAAEAYEHSEEAFTERLVSPTEQAEGILRQSMSEGEPGYDPDLESTTETDIREISEGAEDFFESKAGNKLVDTNPELAAGIELAAKKADQLMSEINATLAETDALKALLAGKEVTNKTVGNLGAALSKLTDLELSRAELSRLLDAPEGVIDQLDAIKRPGKDVQKLKDQITNGSARLVKLEELSSYKKELEQKLPEVIATLASKVDASELTEQTLEQKVPYQIGESIKELEQTLGTNQTTFQQLVERGDKLIKSEQDKPRSPSRFKTLIRVAELSRQGQKINQQVEVTRAYAKVLESNVGSGSIDKHTVIELSQAVAQITKLEQLFGKINQELNQENSAVDLLSKLENQSDEVKKYRATLEQAVNSSEQTDQLAARKKRLSELLGQSIRSLAEKAGQDKDKMAWVRKMVDWSKEVSEPATAEIYIDDDELDEKLMAEINEQIEKEEITKKFATELGGAESDDQPEISEAELEAMEKIANQKFDVGDRVFVETFGHGMAGEVKQYTDDGLVEVRFDDGAREFISEGDLKPATGQEQIVDTSKYDEDAVQAAKEKSAKEKLAGGELIDESKLGEGDAEEKARRAKFDSTDKDNLFDESKLSDQGKPIELMSSEEQAAGVLGEDDNADYHTPPKSQPSVITKRKARKKPAKATDEPSEESLQDLADKFKSA